MERVGNTVLPVKSAQKYTQTSLSHSPHQSLTLYLSFTTFKLLNGQAAPLSKINKSWKLVWCWYNESKSYWNNWHLVLMRKHLKLLFFETSRCYPHFCTCTYIKSTSWISILHIRWRKIMSENCYSSKQVDAILFLLHLNNYFSTAKSAYNTSHFSKMKLYNASHFSTIKSCTTQVILTMKSLNNTSNFEQWNHWTTQKVIFQYWDL